MFFFTVLLPQLLRSLLPNPQESRRATPFISAVFLRKEIKKELLVKEFFFALDVSAQRSVKDASLRRRPIACFLCVALRCAGRNRMQGGKKGKENAKTHSAANSSPCIPPCFCSIPLPSSLHLSLPPNLIHPLAPPPPLLSSLAPSVVNRSLSLRGAELGHFGWKRASAGAECFRLRRRVRHALRIRAREPTLAAAK